LEEDQQFADYSIENVVVGSDTITASDFITQKWLDNDFYGAFLNYSDEFLSDRLQFNAGAAFYRYDGNHFGEVIWSEYASSMGDHFEWYRNDAWKNDGNVYTQIQYSLTPVFSWYLDLQLRNVQYSFTGFDYDMSDDLVELDQQVNLLFFNPKTGITIRMSPQNLIYISFATSAKEPNRNDYVESTPLSRPEAERLYDLEAGYKAAFRGWEFQSNLYYMHYVNQLVLNGQINDVGAYTRINVPRSYRTGIELAWAKTFFTKFDFNGSLSLSRNIITSYDEYIDNWDTGLQEIESYRNTTIAFSPAVVGSGYLGYIVLSKSEQSNQSKLVAGIRSKYVGQQYIDNTGSEERSLDPYFLNDFSITGSISNRFIKDVAISFVVQNLFNHRYESNAWVYRYVYEGMISELNGYYPQAGRTAVIYCTFSF
jgi:iron complex outermembrane receptor protein